MSNSLFHPQQIRKFRIILLICLVFLVPIGLASKYYRGPLEWWVNDFSGDILYESFWILLVVLIWPEESPAKVAFGVFVVTSLIEVLQLWQPPFLQAIRATFIGRTLLGTTFVWWDFPHYFLGCVLTWLGLVNLKSRILSRGEEIK